MLTFQVYQQYINLVDCSVPSTIYQPCWLFRSINLKSEYDRLRQNLDEAITEEKKSRQLLNTIRDDYKKLQDLSSKNSELEKLQDQLVCK